ncbi:Modification methylase DpnIIA [bioreactor metagenome]|uniref:site-specific DNA-methyltransferase (adenine-specific) n=1 Tax=bioreactor metagenome TaxID=1076179 RepID=A0A644WWH1_9ZZZZ
MNSFIGWIGGKRQLRKEILHRFPKDIGRYIEVFGGAGWVLFGKEQMPGQMEVFNDLNGDLINLYRCVKYHADAVRRELDGILDSRELFFDCLAQLSMRGLTDIQRAARYLYLIKFSFGSDQRTFATAPKSIANTMDMLPKVKERLKHVVIERRDFEPLVRTYDRTDALFYLDPPYVGTEKYYSVGFDTMDHARLASMLHGIKGRFILSYNDDNNIRDLYPWCRIESVSRSNTLSGSKSNATPFREIIICNF